MTRVSLCSLFALVLLASSAFAQPTPGQQGAVGLVAAPGGANKVITGRAPAPQPSRRMGRRAKEQAVLKSVRKDYSSFLCPDQSVACPVKAGLKEESLATLADWFKIGFECLDVKTTNKSCGGCSSLGAGQDCTAIPHSLSTTCEAGQCVVSRCKDGYALGRDGKTCVRRSSKTGPQQQVHKRGQ